MRHSQTRHRFFPEGRGRLLAAALWFGLAPYVAGGDPPAPEDAQPPDVEPDAQVPPDMGGEGERGRRPSVTLSTFWIPYLHVRADEDAHEPGSGILFEADLASGAGWGVRAGFGERKYSSQVSLGLLYETTLHRERDFGTHARTHSAYLEMLATAAGPQKGPIKAMVGVGAGVGGAAFDFHRGYDTTGGAAIQGRLVAGISIYDALSLEAGGAAFLWGYPGETMGYGAFWTLGASLTF